MSFASGYDDTESPGWGAPAHVEAEDVVTAAIKKEKVVK